jgi:hypothetical protein
LGTHGTGPGLPARPGIPAAPGYVPKYESNDRFSCMMITTWRILWIPTPVTGGATVVVGVVAVAAVDVECSV